MCPAAKRNGDNDLINGFRDNDHAVACSQCPLELRVPVTEEKNKGLPCTLDFVETTLPTRTVTGIGTIICKMMSHPAEYLLLWLQNVALLARSAIGHWACQENLKLLTAIYKINLRPELRTDMVKSIERLLSDSEQLTCLNFQICNSPPSHAWQRKQLQVFSDLYSRTRILLSLRTSCSKAETRTHCGCRKTKLETFYHVSFLFMGNSPHSCALPVPCYIGGSTTINSN